MHPLAAPGLYGHTIDPPQRGIGVRGINIKISDFTEILIYLADVSLNVN